MKKRLIRLTNIDEVLDKSRKLVILEKGDILSPMIQDYIRENNYKVVNAENCGCEQKSETSIEKQEDSNKITNKKAENVLSEENIIFIVGYLGKKYGINDKVKVQKIISKIMTAIN